MPSILQAILTLISVAPTAISEIETLYHSVKDGLSTDDQDQINAALAAAQTGDKAATEAADQALQDASAR